MSPVVNRLVRKATFDYERIIAKKSLRAQSLAVPPNFNELIQQFAEKGKFDFNNPHQLASIRK